MSLGIDQVRSQPYSCFQPGSVWATNQAETRHGYFSFLYTDDEDVCFRTVTYGPRLRQLLDSLFQFCNE